MKKSPLHITLVLLQWALLCFMVWPQNANAQEKCATHLIQEQQLQSDYQEYTKKFESWLQNKQQARAQKIALNGKLAQEPLQIPVVFHVLHRGENIGVGLNLDKARLDRQLETLNEDFNLRNEDFQNTLAEFIGFGANIDIEFIYAKQDPEGYQTDGIVRQVANQFSYSFEERAILATESYWPPESYLNIWIMDIKSPNLGWAEFPETTLNGIDQGNINPNADGVAIDYQYIGDNPNSPVFESFGRTLTHEMGHFFGLRHIWGDGGCNADDFCADTPFSSRSSTGCDLTKTSCDSKDMIQNFMDYTNDACMTLFTEDQKSRMRTVIENSPRRVSLTNSIALTEPPILNKDATVFFSKPSSYRSSCSTSYIPSVVVRNLGIDTLFNYRVKLFLNDTLTETITSEIPLKSGDQITIDFSALDFEIDDIKAVVRYRVDIIGFQDQRNSNNEIEEYIQLLGYASIPYLKNFNSDISDWYLRNPDQEETWQAGPTGTFVPTYLKRANLGEKDALISPIFDFTNIDIPELSITYAQSFDSIPNRFSIYASYDCGESFTDLVYASYATDLVSAYPVEGEFIPKYDLDWDTLQIDLSRFRNDPSVSFKLELENKGANNFYLGEFNLSESEKLDYELTPIGWKELNPRTCSSTTLGGQLLVKNSGRAAITSYQITLSSSSNIIFDKTYQDVILQNEVKSIDIPKFDEKKQVPIITGLLVAVSVNGGASQKVTKVQGMSISNNCREETPPTRLDLDKNGSNNFYNFDFLGDGNWKFDYSTNAIVSSSKTKLNGSEDWLISPIVNAENIDYMSLIFDVSYHKPYHTNEGLFIYLQPIDTAADDILIYAKIGDSLATSLGNDVPNALSYRNELIDLSNYLYHDKFRVIIKSINQNGADIHLKDISLFLGNDLPPDYPDTLKPFVVYPNPVIDGKLYLHFNLPIPESGKIFISNAKGELIQEFIQPKIINQFITFSVSNLASGLYILHYQSASIQSSVKFLVN